MKRPPRKKKITHTLLVDGDAILKTSYYGAKNMYYNGHHIGGLYQFVTTLRKVINESIVDKVYVFWDGEFSGKLRYEVLPEYKANRGKNYEEGSVPQDLSLLLQKERVKLYLEELYIRQYQDPVVESDDCIAYYCQHVKPNEKVVILTNDRDMCQLINDDVSVFFQDKKTKVTPKNFDKFFGYHYENALLMKVIQGDNSDNIKGVKGVKSKTIIKHIPEVLEQKVTLNEIFDKLEDIQSSRKTRLVALDNIIKGVTVGSQGKLLYKINTKIMDLSNPMLTRDCRKSLDELFDAPIDPDGRTNKNLLEMMSEDGIIDAIPGGYDGYLNYLMPFQNIIKQEKKLFLKS
ncbi:MAG: hypothetical protein CL885_00100 [Dehalococcoidia bacterium]|nr:hypothetical protein [Dehalococcoidia bacterium]